MAPYDLRELLPLDGAAMLLTAVDSADAARASCRACVPEQSPFARGPDVSGFVALEIAAQAAGAHGSIAQQMAGTFVLPRAGYLVVVRDARIERPRFAAGAELVIEVEADGDAAALALYRFSVREGDGLIADGSLGTFVDRPDG